MNMAKPGFFLIIAAGILLSASVFAETRLPIGDAGVSANDDRNDDVCRPYKNKIMVLEGKVETLQAELRRLILEGPAAALPAAAGDRNSAVGYLSDENRQLKELLNAEAQRRLTLENDYANLKEKTEELKALLEERKQSIDGLELKLSTQTEVNRKLIREKIPAEKQIEHLNAKIETLTAKITELERALKRAELEVQNKDELLRQCYDRSDAGDGAEAPAASAPGSPQSNRLKRLQEIILKIK